MTRPLELDRDAHVDEVDLCASGKKLRKLAGRNSGCRHGKLPSSFEFRSLFTGLAGCFRSCVSEGAELGPQLPLSQVFTPKRGSTHA